MGSLITLPAFEFLKIKNQNFAMICFYLPKIILLEISLSKVM